MREAASVLDFGADPTGRSDASPAIRKAIAAASHVYFPRGHYRVDSAIVIAKPVTLSGEGISATVIERGYSPAHDYDGVFNLRDGGTEVSIEDMTIRSKSGQSGGTLISIVPTNEGTLGLYNFDNLDLTTTGHDTHAYTVWIDGTARTRAPIGVRGISFANVWVFGASTKIMHVAGVVQFGFFGGGVFSAGGSSRALDITGSELVPTTYLTIVATNCGVDFNLDWLNLASITCPVIGSISNTTHTVGISVRSLLAARATVQRSWLQSSFENFGRGGTHFREDGYLEAGGGAFVFDPASGISLRNGSISAYRQDSSSLGRVGNVGAPGTIWTRPSQTFSFDVGSASLFTIATREGAAALVFVDFKQSSVILLANPSAAFEAGSSPASGHTGLYKSANSHTISVFNNVGEPVEYQILAIGPVTSVTRVSP